MANDRTDHNFRDGDFVGAEGGSGYHEVNAVHHHRVHVSEIRRVAHEGLGVGVGEESRVEGRSGTVLLGSGLRHLLGHAVVGKR